jgi:hypothetical protein
VNNAFRIDLERKTGQDSPILKPTVLLFYLIPLSVAAFLSTLASGSIGSLSGWGFPLQWKIGGCTYINGGLVCAEEFDNLLFFAADTAFFVLVGYAVMFAGYRLAPRIIERVANLGPRSVLFAALFGLAISLATGFLSSGQFVSPGGFSGQSYGFPLSGRPLSLAVLRSVPRRTGPTMTGYSL